MEKKILRKKEYLEGEAMRAVEGDEWDTFALRRLLGDMFSDHTYCSKFEITSVSYSGERRAMLLTTYQTYYHYQPDPSAQHKTHMKQTEHSGVSNKDVQDV